MGVETSPSQSFTSGAGRQAPRKCGVGRVLISLVSGGCVRLASVAGPAVFMVQMGTLDLVVLRDSVWGLAFIVVEVCLLFNMFRHCSPTQVVRSGSLQWIVYSWLIAAKTGVLYFRILPSMTLDMLYNLSGAMCLTPVFYCIVTFRTLREVFDGSHGDARRERKANRSGSQQGRWGEHGTLDVVLLQDMVWHVVIDMVDIVSMLMYANVKELGNSVDELLLLHYPNEVKSICLTAGVFVVLGLFFHQQSFPSINFAGSRDGDATAWFRSSTTRSSDMEHATPSMLPSTRIDFPSLSAATLDFGGSEYEIGGRTAAMHSEARLHRQHQRTQQREYGVDTVKARKRSAIVSILLVDLPFFGIRSWMYLLSLWASEIHMDSRSGLAAPAPVPAPSFPPVRGPVRPDTSVQLLEQRPVRPVRLVARASMQSDDGDTSEAYKPRLDKWWVKNVMCLILQAMQLRFVQRADLEKSQKAQWMTVHRSEASATRMARRRRSDADRKVTAHLRRTWEEWDQDERRKMDVQVSGSSHQSELEDGSDARVAQLPFAATFGNDSGSGTDANVNSAGGAAVALDVTKGTMDTDVTDGEVGTRGSGFWAASAASVRRRCGRRWCCFCSRLCCGLHCTAPLLNLLVQAAAGFVLGWFIAKTNFMDTLIELQVGLQAEQGNGDD